jgi:hypothetical protein
MAAVTDVLQCGICRQEYVFAGRLLQDRFQFMFRFDTWVTYVSHVSKTHLCCINVLGVMYLCVGGHAFCVGVMYLSVGSHVFECWGSCIHVLGVMYLCVEGMY